MAEQHEYHFDCGNSNEGPIGFSAVITAETPEEALAILKDKLPEELMAVEANELPGAKDYIQVYFNSDAITLADNDFDEEIDDDEEDDDGEEEEDEASSDSGE